MGGLDFMCDWNPWVPKPDGWDDRELTSNARLHLDEALAEGNNSEAGGVLCADIFEFAAEKRFDDLNDAFLNLDFNLFGINAICGVILLLSHHKARLRSWGNIVSKAADRADVLGEDVIAKQIRAREG